MEKQCIRCREIKVISEFGKDSSRKDGLKEICKKCRALRRKQLYNKEARSKETKKYYKENKKDILEYAKVWRLKNKERVKQNARKYMKTRRAIDKEFKILCNLRTRLYCAVKKQHKSGSAVKDLGCSIAELKIYLESKFQPGMTWENYGHKGWHIDHIIPLSKFDLNDRIQFIKACHYTNLQPLWAKDNILKRDKVI